MSTDGWWRASDGQPTVKPASTRQVGVVGGLAIGVVATSRLEGLLAVEADCAVLHPFTRAYNRWPRLCRTVIDRGHMQTLSVDSIFATMPRDLHHEDHLSSRVLVRRPCV
jgi:hypothetical protein